MSDGTERIRAAAEAVAEQYSLPVDEVVAMIAVQKLTMAYAHLLRDDFEFFDGYNQMIIDFHRGLIDSIDFSKFGQG